LSFNSAAAGGLRCRQFPVSVADER
jgi:hypothetical protein